MKNQSGAHNYESVGGFMMRSLQLGDQLSSVCKLKLGQVIVYTFPHQVG